MKSILNKSPQYEKSGSLDGGKEVKVDATNRSCSENCSGRRTAACKLLSLQDVDDQEINRYLLNKEEVQLKKVLWEAINKNCEKVKSLKRSREAQTDKSASKVRKTTEKKDGKERLSEKINFAAVQILNDELEFLSQEAGKYGDVNKDHDSISETVGDREQMSGGTYGDEFEFGIESGDGEDDNTFVVSDYDS